MIFLDESARSVDVPYMDVGEWVPFSAKKLARPLNLSVSTERTVTKRRGQDCEDRPTFHFINLVAHIKRFIELPGRAAMGGKASPSITTQAVALILLYMPSRRAECPMRQDVRSRDLGTRRKGSSEEWSGSH